MTDPGRITSLVFPPSGPVFKPDLTVKDDGLLIGFEAPVAGYCTIMADLGIEVISQDQRWLCPWTQDKFKDVIYAASVSSDCQKDRRC